MIAKRILVVDDDPLIIKLVQKIISTYGNLEFESEIEIDSAMDGSLALVKLTEKKYDFVIIDINMPTLDGLSTIMHIRSQNGINQKIPFLIVTGSQIELEIDVAKVFLLEKPIVIEKMMDVLKKEL